MILITDTHFDNQNINIVEGIFDQCFNLALKNDKIVAHLGDWFTSRTGQSLLTLMAVKRVLDKAQSLGLKIYSIAGNHDKMDLDSEDSYMNVFLDHPALVLFPACGIIQFGRTQIHMLPYFKEDGQYVERLENLRKKTNKNKINFLLTHITLNGAVNNDGTKQNNTLNQELFEGFNWVLSGHYHNRNSPWDRAKYIGSPRAANYGEDDKKGFTLLNQDGSMKFLKSNSPGFYQIYFDLEGDEKIFETEYLRALELAAAGNRVRAVVYGPREMVEACPRAIFTDYGVEFTSKEGKTLSRADLEQNLSTNYTSQEIKKYFVEYCRERQITGKLLLNGLKLIKNV